jgi:hypothetical protein
MNGAGSKPWPLSSPVHDLVRKETTLFTITHAVMITVEAITNCTVPIASVMRSATRGTKPSPKAPLSRCSRW